MPEAWTGRLVGKMHNARITQQELAEEMNYTKAYVSMVLGGARKPKGARERFEAAFDSVKQKKGKS